MGGDNFVRVDGPDQVTDLRSRIQLANLCARPCIPKSELLVLRPASTAQYANGVRAPGDSFDGGCMFVETMERCGDRVRRVKGCRVRAIRGRDGGSRGKGVRFAIVPDEELVVIATRRQKCRLKTAEFESAYFLPVELED